MRATVEVDSSAAQVGNLHESLQLLAIRLAEDWFCAVLRWCGAMWCGVVWFGPTHITLGGWQAQLRLEAIAAASSAGLDE